ncbi:f-box wd repeat-containing protein 10 [Vairimorpha apis BRL 01]|uniref:F-box wd repeat-containing protein 10 n=1 Tax=Vairimorpha apis BRL 01 TaxID=1037528 RepID=T0L5T9_9MICR|nr:f-box wd repeat-containing protein 10 [Vairimorpha apis BRL 01]
MQCIYYILLNPIIKVSLHKLPFNFKFIKSCKNINLIALISDNKVEFLRDGKQSSISDKNKEEIFTCLDFIYFKNILFACIGGTLGIIKIVNVINGSFYNYISAHTGEILDIKCTEKYIITSSDDCSIKLWDFETLSCIRIFAGLEYKNPILSLDLINDKLLGAGIDCKIFEWKINTEKDIFIFKSIFVGSDLHRSAIIKSRYCNEIIISLSSDGRISIIKPIYNKKFDFVFLKEIFYENKITDFEIFNDTLICLTINELYKHNLSNLFDEYDCKHIKLETKDECVCITVNRDFIYVLTKTNTLEIIDNKY